MKKTINKINKKWKIAIILCSALLIISLLLNVGVLAYDLFGSAGGAVTKVSARRGGENEIVLKIHYVLPTGGYSVRNVPEDEGEYCGDGMGDYDGSIGQYRIVIRFGDVAPSTAMGLRMMIDDTLKTFPIKLKTKMASPEDHGFVLYVGSDTPIRVEDVKSGELHPIGGTMKIPITWEKA